MNALLSAARLGILVAGLAGAAALAQPSPAPTPAAAPAVNSSLPPPSATEIWEPIPVVVTAEPNVPPSDAVVLFDGKNLDAWESAAAPARPAPWKVEGDVIVCAPGTGDIRTKAAFGDIQLHLEFRTPAVVKGKSQERGNSGVFFMGLYELQVLDSYDNPTYVNGQAGSLYKQYPPLVNASRKPGEWQTYDAVWIAPRFGPGGHLISPARLTVFHNGVLVQNNVTVLGPTSHRGYPAYQPHAARLPLELQDHHNTVAFRNIWVRELVLP